MRDWTFGHEPALRLGFFFGVFVVMAVWESVAARRELRQSRGGPWLIQT